MAQVLGHGLRGELTLCYRQLRGRRERVERPGQGAKGRAGSEANVR